MAFDERAIIQRTLDRAGDEFVKILRQMIKLYPDVARRGVTAMLLPIPDAATDRRVRSAFANTTDLDAFLERLTAAVNARSEQEVFDSLTPRRFNRPLTEDEEVFGRE